MNTALLLVEAGEKQKLREKGRSPVSLIFYGFKRLSEVIFIFSKFKSILTVCFYNRKRRPKLMRRVRSKLLLCIERILQAVEHLIESLCQVLYLILSAAVFSHMAVIMAADIDPFSQIPAVCYFSCCRIYGADRQKRSFRYDVSSHQGCCRYDRNEPDKQAYHIIQHIGAFSFRDEASEPEPVKVIT